MDPASSPAVEAWLDLLAALHVAAIHFPIALLLAAALFELGGTVLGLMRDGAEARPSRAALACLVLAVLGAGLAAASGWTLAERDPLRPSLAEAVDWHRWTGVTTAGLALLALLPALITVARPSLGLRRLYRLLLFAAAAAASLAGHQGGELVHGTGHLTEPLQRALFGPQTVEAGGEGPAPGGPPSEGPAPENAAPPTAAPAPADPAHAAGLAPNEPEALAVAARALLASRCVECHGDAKQKADLRLDTRGAIVDEGFVAFPGDAAGSLIVERVALPAEHEDRMPPEGPPLTPAEVALLTAWIDAGVPWPADGLAADG